MKKWKVLRLSLVIFAFVFLYFLLLSRLFYWQVIRGEELKKIGKLQSTESLIIEATRGEVLSSDNYPLLTNKFSYILFANPKLVREKKEVAEKLSSLLSLDQASVSAKLSKNLFWVKIADNLGEEEKEKIEKLNISGIGFQEQSQEFYPEASMAAHLLGFVGKDNSGRDHGYFGVEGYYNEQLQGRSGTLYVVKDALGNTILNDVREEKKIDGRTLVLTIDRTVQFVVEKRLQAGIEKYGADGGSAIVINSETGKILAMASRPSFNPQKYYEYDTSSYVNPAISSLYEPGSSFKVLVMAVALDLHRVKPDERCPICTGPINIGEYTIKTWNDKYYPNSTMTEVIQHSDNTGMVFVGKKLGLSHLLSYLKRFGIGEETGIDLQGETTKTLRNQKNWYPVDVATVTFGQGISVTPIQLLSAVNSLANGGNLIKPYVVSKIITESGKKIDIKPEVRQRVVSETTAKIMTWMMVNAVENGEAKWTKIKDYKIAGKTGTAQIPVAGHYDPDKTITSFVGFFPADKPKVSILVLLDKPKTSIFGSETAAPIFFNIARDLIHYYNIPPSY